TASRSWSSTRTTASSGRSPGSRSTRASSTSRRHSRRRKASRLRHDFGKQGRTRFFSESRVKWPLCKEVVSDPHTRMLAKRIIPCLDVAGGRVVKGVKFVNLRDAGDPVEIARRYDAEGADEIAFLDIRASIETRGLLYAMIEAVANEVFIPLTVGGGVNSVADIRALLNAGADKVSINTGGVK